MSDSGSMRRTTVIDYGLGNLFSIIRALAYVGSEAEVTSDPTAIRRASRLVLPGVGAFGDGMQQLRRRGLTEPIREAAADGRPLLGICLGMQLFFTASEEFGVHEGLGIFPGRVMRLQHAEAPGEAVKIPHVGWGALCPAASGISWEASVLRGLPEGEAMYFVHSFVPYPECDDIVVARHQYGGRWYDVAVQRGRTVGCQFHPEKSGEAGLHLLRNFLEL